RLTRCTVRLLNRHSHMDVGEAVVRNIQLADATREESSTVVDAVARHGTIGTDIADGVAGELNRVGIENLEDDAGRIRSAADVPHSVARNRDITVCAAFLLAEGDTTLHIIDQVIREYDIRNH